MHVEGDELVFDAVTCAACGAKVREDRPHCLRCGKPLVAAADTASASRLPLGTFALVVGCLALIGVAAMMARGSSVGESPSPVTASGSEPIDDRAEVPVRVEAPVSGSAGFAPDPLVVAFESRSSGVAAYSRGDLAAALEEFTRAVDAHPEDAEALNNLGQVLVRSGRAKEAIEHFDNAIALANDRWAYHFNRARAYADLRDWATAVAGYRDAAQLFPDDYVTQFNLARALQASGDLAGALEGFEQAISLAPGEPNFHLSYAGALDKAQRPADAAAAYRRYLELDSTTPHAEKIKARLVQLEGTTTRP